MAQPQFGEGMVVICGDDNHQALSCWKAPDTASTITILGSITTYPHPTPMPTLTEKLRNLFLNSEDRLMVKYALENPAGKPTSEGLEVMQDFLYRKFRSELIVEVQKLKAEEEKK